MLLGAQVFRRATQAAGFSLTEIPGGAGADAGAAAASHAHLRSAVGDAEYFLALLPDGSRLVRPIMRGAR